MSADAEFPEPKDCPTLEQHLLKAPKPWDAIDNPMEARVRVTFYTYCGLHKQSIYRHTDTYRRGNYRPSVEEELVAGAPGGVAF
jgi:hypothetical protein